MAGLRRPTIEHCRRGGETGVAAVTCLEGEKVWRAAAEGLYSRDLAVAACATIEGKPEGSMEDNCKNPALFLVEYRDGLKGSILMLNGYVHDFLANRNMARKRSNSHEVVWSMVTPCPVAFADASSTTAVTMSVSAAALAHNCGGWVSKHTQSEEWQ